MSDLLVLVAVVGVGIWAYRQWKLLNGAPQPRSPLVPVTEVIPAEWQAADGAVARVEAAGEASSPQRKWVLNRWVVLALCVAWIVSPLDGDFVPFLGWVDDLFAAYIAYRSFKQ